MCLLPHSLMYNAWKEGSVYHFLDFWFEANNNLNLISHAIIQFYILHFISSSPSLLYNKRISNLHPNYSMTSFRAYVPDHSILDVFFQCRNVKNYNKKRKYGRQEHMYTPYDCSKLCFHRFSIFRSLFHDCIQNWNIEHPIKISEHTYTICNIIHNKII